jgi:hypothetical protein
LSQVKIWKDERVSIAGDDKVRVELLNLIRYFSENISLVSTFYLDWLSKKGKEQQ